VENTFYAAGSAEPPLVRIYPTSCTPFSTAATTLIVDDLTDSSNNVLGCAGRPWGGKFTLRTGYPPGSTYAAYGQVDLHQLGAGYLGHSWFSHAYHFETSSDRDHHQVIGTWTPDITNADVYDILVHLTSHGSTLFTASYIIKGNGPNGGEQECDINQNLSDGNDKWAYLGKYAMYAGGRVQLSNNAPGGDGTVDVGYDAMAFVPWAAAQGEHFCGENF
jgi:hypothetical protein